MSKIESRIAISIPDHGSYSCSAYALDRVIEKYLPASPARLRKIVEANAGTDYSDVREVSTFLVILADFEEAYFNNLFATNGPAR
jgi:hypothetical protein